MPRSLQGLTILVVDDCRANQMVAEAMLSQHGGTVHVANDGDEAVRLVDQGLACDVVLMDLQMPVMDGVTAARRIRALPGPKGALPVIAFSACDGSDQLSACTGAGMDGFVCKPVERGALLHAILGAINCRSGFVSPRRNCV
jgi:CheY-like chemotaxis protein